MCDKVKVLEYDGRQQYKFICPACNCEHIINDSWQFNKDLKNPTFSPSIKVNGFLGFDEEEEMYGVCHSFIKDGMIQYLGDCTHKLKNQTVELLKFTS